MKPHYRIECADCPSWMVGRYTLLRDFMRAHYRVTVQPAGDDPQGCSPDPLLCVFGTKDEATA